MTCKFCIEWCATTEAQLANRERHMIDAPQVQTHPCPHCQGNDWATSREMIRPQVPWHDRIVRWFGENPNAWRVLISLNVALALLSISAAIFLEQPRWVTLLQVGVAGFCVSQATTVRQMMNARRSFNELCSVLDQMQELNRALITGRFEAMVIRPREDDDAPEEKKLH